MSLNRWRKLISSRFHRSGETGLFFLGNYVASKRMTKMLKKSINEKSWALGSFFQTLSKTKKKLSEKTERCRAGKNMFFWKVAFSNSPKNENAIAGFCISVGSKKIYKKMTSLGGVHGKQNLKKKSPRSLVYANACAPKL